MGKLGILNAIYSMILQKISGGVGGGSLLRNLEPLEELKCAVIP